MTYGAGSGPTGAHTELNQFPADFGPATSGAAKAISAEYTSFTKFKQDVDKLIEDLKKSPAGDKQLKASPLARAAFSNDGDGWGAAADLYDQYHSVISDLESLSKLLSDSMDAMAVSVVASHKGYANIDADIRDRVRKIYAETSKHYNEQPEGLQTYGKDPYAKYDHGHQAAPTGDQQPQTDGSDHGNDGGEF